MPWDYWRQRDESGRWRKRPAGYLGFSQGGEVEEFRGSWIPGEEEEPEVIEGEPISEEEFRRSYSPRGGGLGSPIFEEDYEEEERSPWESREFGEAGFSYSRRPKGTDWLGRKSSPSAPKKDLTEDLARKFRELELETAEASLKTKLEEFKKERRKFRREYRPSIPKLAGKLSQIGVLGYPKKQAGSLYFPKAKGIHDSSGMRALTVPPGMGSAIAEVNRPQLGLLKSATAPPPSRPIGNIPTTNWGRGEIGTALGRLREVSKLSLTHVENAALSEIRDNNDRDTLKHITSELSQLGIAKKDAEEAVMSLVQKKVVQPIVESPGDKPIYEVVR